MLKYQYLIDQAAKDGDNDRVLELLVEQKDYYDFFGYGTTEERAEWYASKGRVQ